MVRDAHEPSSPSLRWSPLIFAVEAGALNVAFMVIFGMRTYPKLITLPEVVTPWIPPLNPDSQLFAILLIAEAALLTMPGAALGWWLLVVLPRRTSALDGGFAGIIAFVLALMSACLLGRLLAPYTVASLPLLQRLHQALRIWYMGLLFISISYLGWGLPALYVAIGALYARYLRRRLAATSDGRELASSLMPRP